MGKSKTHEEYVEELKIKNPNVEVIGTYVNAKTAITHRCLVHNVEWDIRPNDALSGKSCKLCGIEKQSVGRSKTHEQYVIELSEKNPNLEVIEKYKGINKAINHKCKKHNIIWKCIPHNALYGVGCDLCRQEKYYKARAKTHEQYVKEVKDINPNIEVIDKYISMDTKIKHKCIVHNIEWEITPMNILSGCGCKECKKEKIIQKNSITHEEYCSKLKTLKPHYEVLETYSGMNTLIKHKCAIHDTEWSTLPYTALYGYGCPDCRYEQPRYNSLTNEEYIKRMEIINPNVLPIETYKGMNESIEHKCLIHNNIWKLSPISALRGSGCPECSKEKKSISHLKTHEQYLGEIKKLGLEITVAEEYKGANVPIAHLCNIHNELWYPTPNNVLRGNSCGCYKCKISNGENIVEKWLIDNNIKYELQKRFIDCIDTRPLPFDFYLPELNKCIEFDGKQHFEPIDYFGGQDSYETTVYHDKIKTDYCEQNNIPLLRIPFNANIEEELNNFLFN